MGYIEFPAPPRPPASFERLPDVELDQMSFTKLQAESDRLDEFYSDYDARLRRLIERKRPKPRERKLRRIRCGPVTIPMEVGKRKAG